MTSREQSLTSQCKPLFEHGLNIDHRHVPQLAIGSFEDIAKDWLYRVWGRSVICGSSLLLTSIPCDHRMIACLTFWAGGRFDARPPASSHYAAVNLHWYALNRSVGASEGVAGWLHFLGNI